MLPDGVSFVVILLHLRSFALKRWALRKRSVAADPDDNRFTDCAITANADYVITGDSHFDPLAGSDYKPQPITPEEFVRRHLTGA